MRPLMGKTLFALCFAAGIAGLGLMRPSAAGELAVVSEGESPYVIAWAEDAFEKKITEAAELLQVVVAEATGVELPVVRESDAPPGAPAIYLGRSQAAREAGIPVDEVDGWSYLNRVVGEDIFLVGEDLDGWEGHGGFSGYGGTLKAVTAFLESEVGARFVLSGRMGIHVPELERIAVDAALDTRWSPLFRFVIGRRVSPWPGGDDYDPYAVANNYFGRYANDTLVFSALGSHSYPDFVPHEEHFEAHPEYFALINGRRDPRGRRNLLCISHPDVHELLLAGMERELDRGFQMVMLGQSDGYIECQCERCQAIHPDMGEKIWIVHRMLAKEMKQRRPGKQAVLLSYVSTTKPPMTFDSFPDNVVILNNRYVPEYFEAWERFGTPTIVYFPDWLRRWPRIPPRYSVDLVRLWLENNVIGIYLGGGLDSGTSPWGLNGPAYYAFGKAMEDPTRDADELEREYVAASFGAAAGPMLAFFETMHRRIKVRALFDRRGMGVPDRRYRGHPFEMKPGDYLCHFFAPQILNDMSAHLDRALARAENEDEKVRARLELVEAEFRYLKRAATMQHVFRAYRAAPSWHMLNAVEKQVEAHRETLEWLLPDGQPREPGARQQLRTPYNTGWPVNQSIGVPDSPPHNWDFDAIRAAGELPDPEVRVRVRGGQTLKPYVLDDQDRTAVGAREAAAVPDEQADDGFADPNIRAPYDQ